MIRKSKFYAGVIFAAVVYCLSVFSVCAETVDSGICGVDIKWEISDDGILTITGNGEMDDYREKAEGVIYFKAPWYGWTAIIETAVISEGITNIGDNAFEDCTSLKNVSLPESLTSIGESAFEYCGSLESVNVPEGVKSIGKLAFFGCDRLEISLPTKMESIGSQAFCGCDSLINISLPEGLKNIASGMFESCTNLKSVSLPKGVESIGSSAFEGCPALERINLPEELKSIEQCAFAMCKKLKSISLPGGLRHIGNYAFFRCTSLDVECGTAGTGDSLADSGFPVSEMYIGKGAFEECNNLKNISLSKWIKSIGESAFRDCDSLKHIDLPEGLESIGERAFNGCDSLEHIDLPEGLESIGTSAFAACDSLTSIDLPNGLKNIEAYAFVSCKNLANVNLPEGLEKIGEEAFGLPNEIKRIILPESVTSLGEFVPRHVTIIGKKGSYAETYAKKYHNTFREIDASGRMIWYVTFQDDHGKTIKIQRVKNGKSATAPKLTKEGYSLSWNQPFNKVTGDITAMAIWKPALPKKGYATIKNGLKYKVIKSARKNGTVQLAGTSSKKKTSYTVPEAITIGEYKFKVTGIAGKAFSGCSKAKKISLPKTIVSIGKNAFARVSTKLKISVPKAQYKKISKLIKTSGINKKVVIKKR